MKQFSSLSSLGGFAALLAGISHTFLQSRAHLSIPPHALFFVMLGSAQIWWAYGRLEYRFTKEKFLLLGAAINGGLLFTWLLTRYFPAPFIGSPEAITDIGLLVALCEGVVLASIFESQCSSKNFFREGGKYLGKLFLVSLVAAGLVYGGGAVGEKLFPSFSGGHHHGGHHDHHH